MKALSLWQPWASLVACGAKTVETRHWPAPASIVGERIAVHAAKRSSELHMLRAPDFDRALHERADRVRMVDGRLPLGFIVATAVVSDCVRMDSALIDRVRDEQPDELAFGHWEVGRFAWRLAAVQVVEPVAYRGSQGLFDVTGVLGESPAGEAQTALFGEA